MTVYLPEVTYDAPITVGCAVELVGSGTTFTAPITVAPLKNMDLTCAFVRFRQINFTGDGSGTGITAAAPTYLEESRVTGWPWAARLSPAAGCICGAAMWRTAAWAYATTPRTAAAIPTLQTR